MEQRIITNKYKNITYFESKYVSSKKNNNTEFELINEKKYDYIIKHSPNISENKDISNGSKKNDDMNNSKYNNINNKRKTFYKSLNKNNIEKNNYNYEEYNNGGNISNIQNTNNNSKMNYNISSGNNIIIYKSINNNNDKILKDEPKKFSNVAKALRFIGNKDNSNINLIHKNNSPQRAEYNINKSDFKGCCSTEKINIKIDNKSNKNINKRNFDIQTHSNKNKMNLMISNIDHKKNNTIWSNLNKDLVPTKADLNFEGNNDENNKSLLKLKERYYRSNYTEKNIENNNNNKINGGENNINQFLNEEGKYDTEENNKNIISYKIRIKDIKEFAKPKEDENSNLKKNKSNNNIKVTYDQGRRSNKNIKDVNISNKNQNDKIQTNNINIHNFGNSKSNINTKSSPNILINNNRTKQNDLRDAKTPKIIKDNQNITSLNNSNNGINTSKKNKENILTPIINKKLPLFELNSNALKNINKNEENPVKKIQTEKNMAKLQKEKKEKDINVNDNNKINERIRELKQIMNYNKKVSYRNDDTNNENGIKIDISENNSSKKIQINKNPFLFQQKNDTNTKMVFHKKVGKSPVGLNKKTNITNDNIDTKDNNNIKSIIKINYRNIRNNNIITNIKITNEDDNNNKNKILNKTNSNLNKKENQKNSYILKDIPISNGNGNTGTIYIRQKAIKKIPLSNILTKDKIDNNISKEIKVSKNYKINEVKKNNIYNNIDNADNYLFDKIKEKIKLKYKRVIKYYDFYIHSPKIQKCFFTNIKVKIIKYPKIDLCHISKMNSVIYLLYKNKNICYITKSRQIGMKITQPPINSICEYSKNIILNLSNIKNEQNDNIENNNDKNLDNNEEENKRAITTTKKTKKRKKRRKTRRLHKDINEKNNNLTETKKENTDITSKDLSKEELDKENNEKVLNSNPGSNNINNININITTPEENNIISIPKKYMTNDKSSQDFSEKEILVDLDKNSNLIRKKLSPTTYNDEEFNEEENDDFRIASDDDDLSDDKLKKKQFNNFENNFQNGKTEGKEIIGDYDNKINSEENEKNKMKYQEGLKLLEKLNDKRIVNYFNENEEEYNEEENNIYYDNENIDETEGNNNINNLNKNIILGADKLNLIFNTQKNYKFTSEYNNENDNDNYNDNFDDIYTDSNINVNYSENENNNFIIDKKKNLTYKNNYEKIGSIFDKLEEIFDKKKQPTNIVDINLDKYKTPIMNKGSGHHKKRISDFNLKEEDYNYIDKEDESTRKKKNTYNKKEINVNKYQDIFNNKQQIISKLELLMNKNKSKTNQESININNIDNNPNKIFNYNSPKIESDIDSDMNINKDTPGNRKEIRLYNIKSNPKIKYVYSLEEILSLKNKDICTNTSLLSEEVINHCDSIVKTIKEEYSSFKVNYKEIVVNKDIDKKTSIDKWARKDMTKEIEKAEKYVKDLNKEMSKDNYRHKIIEILNTLTVDNYKNILNTLFIVIFLEEKNSNENNDINNNINISLKNYALNKSEYLLHNQFIFIEIILEKATKEKGYVVLYAKLCADLFIEFIKYIKEINNPEIENQLINGENLKTILTSECKQKFDECISMETLYKNKDKNEEEKKEIFLTFKKKFLGNMDFIAELINVKLLSQTKGFEFLDILYKRYCEIQNEQIKYLNLEGAIILLTKFGKIVFDRKNPKHLQNLDNYIKDNLNPIIEKKDNNNLPNYLKFKIINLIEKKKNNWKDSLYEQSIIAKGKNNNNLSLYHEHSGIDNVNIDESLMDNSMNNKNNFNMNNNINIDIELEKENNIIILIKNDLENYISFLNEHKIYCIEDIIEKDNISDINNEYDWSLTEDLIIKGKNDLEEIIRCYIEVCIDYVQKEQNIFYCNEYIKNIINYYSIDLTKEQTDKVRKSMIDLFLNVEDICLDNFFMFEIMGYLMLILLENYLFYVEDLDQFLDEDKNKIGKIAKVVKFTDNYYQGDKKIEFETNFEKGELFEKNKDIFQ